MRRNFNTAPQPTQAPEFGTGAWDSGGPISMGESITAGGNIVSDWGDTPTSAVIANGSSEWDAPQPSVGNYLAPQESGFSERLRALKDKAIHGMGRRALDAVMNRLPRFDSNSVIFQQAKSAGRETIITGAKAAGRELMDNVGLNYEEGRVSVQSKRKLGMAAIRLVRAPQLEAARLAKESGRAGYGAAKQEAVNQIKNARQNFNVATQPAVSAYESW